MGNYPARPHWTVRKRAMVAAQAICAKYAIAYAPPRDEFVRVEDLADIIAESTGLDDLVPQNQRDCWDKMSKRDTRR